MANQGIKLQLGMFIAEVICSFSYEAQGDEGFQQVRWLDRFRCQRLAVGEHYVVVVRLHMLFQSMGAGTPLALAAGRPMERTKLPLTIWFLTFHLISQFKAGLSALTIKRQLGVS